MFYLKKIVNWLFPLFCAGCETAGEAVCQSCASGIELWPEGQDNSLPDAPEISHLFTVFKYDKGGTLAKLLHLYKYEMLTEYGGAIFDLAEQALSRQASLAQLQNADLLTWVPLHPDKFRQRGFNQARELAIHLPFNLSPTALLKRTRLTPPQMTLNRAGRLQNVKGVFALHHSIQPVETGKNGEALRRPLEGKRILIVDDVITTGATLNEAAMVLKAAGALTVDALVLARQEV